jgi:hypothetical protein
MDITLKAISNPDVVFREGVDKWAVLVNLDNAASIALNPTGVLVWKMIEMEHSIEDIVSTIKHQYKNVPDSVTNDIFSLLHTLAEEGFVGYEV